MVNNFTKLHINFYIKCNTTLFFAFFIIIVMRVE